MKYSPRLLTIAALAAALFAGCDGGGDGNGGNGGTGGGGTGGGGTGGADLCEGVECSDGNECTDDVCDPADGLCKNPTSPDGTPCSGGGCQDGVCTSVFPCTEEGILNAISAGGGPYTFACNGPTTVETTGRILIDNDVILDGEGNLTVDGNDDHPVFSVFGATSDVTAKLRGFVVTGGANGPAISSNQAMFTVIDSTVSGNSDGGISSRGTLTVINSIVSENRFGISHSGTFTLNNSTVSDNHDFGIGNGGTATLNDTTVSGNGGGGISAYEGTLTLNDCVVSGNFGFGGIQNWGEEQGSTIILNNSAVSRNTAEGRVGGIESWGTLILNDSTVSENTGGGTGGILSSGTLTLNTSTVSRNAALWPSSWGGGISSSGEATLIDSTISDNAAANGGGVFNGGTLTLNRCTVSGNTAVHGGGINSEREILTLTNSTVSGNIALETGGGILTRRTATLISCTLSGNRADLGNAIIFADGESTLVNTVIDGDCYVDSWAVVASNGGNIESPDDSCGLNPLTDQVNVPELALNLGPLQDNGGPTLTQDPGGIVAIDAIEIEDCVDADGQPLLVDQRGFGRPEGTKCDVGALEVVP